MLTAQPEIVALTCNPPFNFRQVTGFLKHRAIPGVENVDGCVYSRSIALGRTVGFFSVSCPKKTPSSVRLEIHFPDREKLPLVVKTVEQIFDLNAPANKIDQHLIKDHFLMIQTTPME